MGERVDDLWELQMDGGCCGIRNHLYKPAALVTFLISLVLLTSMSSQEPELSACRTPTCHHPSS